jgi:hypothetical protein
MASVKAHLFDLSEMDPLKCHKDDCVLNILHYLKILEKEKAFKFANVTNQISNIDTIDFLTYIYDTPHGLLEIYNTGDNADPTPDMVDDIMEEQNLKEKLYALLKPDTAAIAIFLGKVNHLALFAKKNDKIYIIDPQVGKEFDMDDPNIGLYLYKFNTIKLITSQQEKLAKVRFNTSQFERKSHMFTNKNRIRKNPTSNTLKWTQYTLQHRGLKPLKKYKIIKKPNKEVRDSVFLRFEGNNAIFEDITVPTAEHFFIELPELNSPKRRKSFNNLKIKSKSKKSKKHSI